MSRAYRIRVAESVNENIHVEDGVQSTLEILDVLPRDAMSELLAAELEKNGFERDGDIMRRTDDDGITIEVDVKEGTVTVKAEGSGEVSKTIERDRWVEEEAAAKAEENLRDAARRQLENEVEAERAKLSEEVAEKLEQKLGDIRDELDKVTNRVTAEALKKKAAQIGEIEEVQEDEGGNVTIKVRV